MATTVAATLGIKPQEAQRILSLFVASFFLGGALLFFYTSSNAIFLTEFSADTLPYVYIVNSVFVIVFGYIYAQIEKRTSLIGLLTLSLGILTVTIFAFWIGLQLSSSRTVIFVMMAWFRLIFIYTTLGLWELASALFDVRQAKRLFALVSLGLLIAFIIGGLSTSLITGLIGTVNLLLLSGIFLLLYAVFLFRLMPLLGEHAKEVTETRQFPVCEMFKDRYIALIFLLKTITIINYYIVEFIFYHEAASRYTGEADLASFLGTFIGISTLLMALIAALFTGRYITRFGLRVALLTMPTILLITAFVSGSYGIFVGIGNTLFFLLAISTKFANEVLEKSLHIPALGVLYQPLPRYKRMPVRVAVEGWFGSVALIGSGVLLLVFNLLPNINITFFIAMSFITTALYVGITALVYRHYQAQLKAAVTTRFITGVTLPSQSPDEEFVNSELHSDHPAKVLAALQYSHHIEEKPDTPYLVSLLDHPADAIKEDVLQRIEQEQYHPAQGKVEQMLADASNSKAVRGQALITLASLAPMQSVTLLSKYLDTELKQSTLTGLLRYGDAVGYRLVHQLVYQKISELAASTAVSDRIIAAELVHHVPQEQKLLLQLLQDTNADVMVTAIRSAENQLTGDVIGLLLSRLRQGKFTRLISSVLSKGDDLVVAAIQLQFEHFSLSQQALVLDVCSKIGSPKALAFLQQFLQRDKQDIVYDAALSALVANGYKEDDIEAPIIREQKNAVYILSLYTATDDELLQRALTYDYKRLQERIFNLLTFAYDKATITDARLALHHPEQEHRANALELLEITINNRLKTSILPIIEDSDLKQRSKDLKIEKISDTILGLSENAQPLSEWTQRCLNYVSDQKQGQEKNNPMYSLIEKVMVLRSVSIFAHTADPILAEVATLLREGKAAAGETLMEKGAMGDSLYIIVDGLVRVHDGNTILRKLGAREIVGEMAVLDPAPRSATVTAETETSYFVLDADMLHDLMNTHPEVNQAIIKVLVQRIRGIDSQPEVKATN